MHDASGDGAQTMIDLLSDRDPWSATTSGERLLFLLLQNHGDWKALAEALKAAKVGLAGRYDSLTNFFVGASVLHLQQRLIRQAQDVREIKPSLERYEQIVELRDRFCNTLQLTPLAYDGEFDILVEEVLTSAEKLPTPISDALKKAVIRNGPNFCHSCGNVFGVPPPGSTEDLKPTADHVWPRALGGDTIEDNLIATCEFCNNAKSNLAAWQMAWIQPIVFSDTDAVSGLNSVSKNVQIALHIRAAMAYAQANGTSLKDAFLAIGPRDPLVRIDAAQGYDFFNLRVHDPVRTAVDWMPS